MEQVSKTVAAAVRGVMGAPASAVEVRPADQHTPLAAGYTASTHEAKARAEAAADRTADAAADAAGQAQDVVSDAATWTQDRLIETGDAVLGTAAAVGQAITGLFGAGKDVAEDVTLKTGDAVIGTAQRAGDAAKDAGAEVNYQARRAANAAQRTADRTADRTAEATAAARDAVKDVAGKTEYQVDRSAHNLREGARTVAADTTPRTGAAYVSTTPTVHKHATAVPATVSTTGASVATTGVSAATTTVVDAETRSVTTKAGETHAAHTTTVQPATTKTTAVTAVPEVTQVATVTPAVKSTAAVALDAHLKEVHDRVAHDAAEAGERWQHDHEHAEHKPHHAQHAQAHATHDAPEGLTLQNKQGEPSILAKEAGDILTIGENEKRGLNANTDGSAVSSKAASSTTVDVKTPAVAAVEVKATPAAAGEAVKYQTWGATSTPAAATTTATAAATPAVATTATTTPVAVVDTKSDIKREHKADPAKVAAKTDVSDSPAVAGAREEGMMGGSAAKNWTGEIGDGKGTIADDVKKGAENVKHAAKDARRAVDRAVEENTGASTRDLRGEADYKAFGTSADPHSGLYEKRVDPVDRAGDAAKEFGEDVKHAAAATGDKVKDALNL